MMKKSVILVAITLLTWSASAYAGDEFESSIVGIEVGGQVIGDNTGGDPWVVEEGEVEIGSDGELEFEVEGLLLLDGTVGPVLSVFASLNCRTGGNDGPGDGFERVARTDNTPLSADGDAESEQTIGLPSVCVAPIVLIQIGEIEGSFIGFPPGPLDVEEVLGLRFWIAASGI